MEPSPESPAGYPPQQSVNSQAPSYHENGYLQPQQPDPVPVVLPEQPPRPRRAWCEDFCRSIPQSLSVSGASFIFISGGMSLAWGVDLATSYVSNSSATRKHMRACWFIGIIIGACIAAYLIDKLSKRLLYLAGSILVAINGILHLPTPLSVPAVVAARYCDGIAFGLVLVPVIMAGSEHAAVRFRGLVLSAEQVGVAIGMAVKVTYTSWWDKAWEFHFDQMHGVLVIACGLLAILCTLTLTIESSSTFLRKDDEAGAVNVIRKLEAPQMGVNESHAILCENKRMLEEDVARGMAENVNKGLVPIVKLSIFRSLVSMSVSLPLTYVFVLVSHGYVTSVTCVWMCIYTAMRLVGVLVAVFTLDSVGRKTFSTIAMFTCGSLLMVIGSVYTDATLVLLLIYQVFAGIAAPASTCYLGEAFSHSVKPYFILCAIAMENLVQIIISVSANYSYRSVSDFSYALGALSIAFAILCHTMMPETKGATLREALAKFGKYDYLLDKARLFLTAKLGKYEYLVDKARLFVTQRLAFRR